MRMGLASGVLLVAIALGGTSCGIIGSSGEGPDGTGSDGGSEAPVEAGPVEPCSLIPDDKVDSVLRTLVPSDATATEADLAVSESTAVVYDACRWEKTDKFGVPERRVQVGVSVTPVSQDEYEDQYAIAKQEAEVVGGANDASLTEAAGGEHPRGFFVAGSEDGPFGKTMSELFILHNDRLIVVSAVSRFGGGPSAPLLIRVAEEALRQLPEQVELPRPNVPEVCSQIDQAAVSEAMGGEIRATRGTGSPETALECAFAGKGRLAKVGLSSGGTGQMLEALGRVKGSRPVDGVGDGAVVSAGGVLTALEGDRAVEVTIRPDVPVDKAAALARAALAVGQ